MRQIKAIFFTLMITLVLVGCVERVVEETTITDVINAIEALPEEINYGDEPQIIEARALFESLTSEDQALVSNIQKLLDAEAALAMLPGTIVDEAVSKGFSVLAAAVTEAGLVPALSGSDVYTVFAPTDEAFGNLLTALDTDAAGLLAHPFLNEILLHHVVQGDVLASAVVALINAGSGEASVETLLGTALTLSLDGSDVVINGSARVTMTDVMASNGVIHVINEVLIPSNIVEIAVAAGFSTLAAAVTQENLVETLSNGGPFTVFAPTNDAFDALIAALETDIAGLLALETLSDVLLYHVVSGKVLAAEVLALINEGSGTATVPTLLDGASLTLTFDGMNVMINDGIKVSATDIIALNGVIHIIDGVLLPPSDDPSSISVTYLGFEDAVLGSETISSGQSLSFPSAPEVAGYTFDGWDNDGSSLMSDTTIRALYSQITFTLEELSQYDGRNGADAYIAYEGVVYDVTNVSAWSGGSHNGYSAGNDLTDALNNVAPHSSSNLTQYPIVGFLVNED